MSCFGGRMSEYERISLDRFDGKNLQSTVYFLSHLHEDHTVGLAEPILLRRLKANKDIFLYCSEVTEVLLRASEKYKHLGPYIKSIGINTPTTIPVPDPLFPEVETVTVTLLPAFHCPGSVMCLIEGRDGTVLYTGDFRWEHFHIEQMHHLRSGERVKKIKSLYADTTFCMPENLFIPSRQQCIDATYHLIHEWTAKSPQHVVYFNLRAQYGHEPLLNAVAARLRKKVHVSKRKFDVYSKIIEFEGNFTSDGQAAQIHACGREGTVTVDDEIIPCRSSHDPEKVLVILPTTMYFMQYQHLTLDKIVKKVGEQFFRVCYSFHSSYTEIKDLLAYLCPEKVCPNVKPPGDVSLAKTQHRLNVMLKECKEKAKTETQVVDEEVKELGTLKTKSRAAKRQRTKDSQSEADSLDFGTPTKALRSATPTKSDTGISLSQDSGTSAKKGRGRGRGKHKATESESQPVVGTRRSTRRSAATADSEEMSEVTPKKRKIERSITPDLFLTPDKSERSDVSEQHSSYAGSNRSESELDLTQSSLKSIDSFEDTPHREPEMSSWSLGSFLAAVSSASLDDDASGCVCVLDDCDQMDENLDDTGIDTTEKEIKHNTRTSGKKKVINKKGKGKGKQAIVDDESVEQETTSTKQTSPAAKPDQELLKSSTEDKPVSVDETDGPKIETSTDTKKTPATRVKPGRRGRRRGVRTSRELDEDQPSEFKENGEMDKTLHDDKDKGETNEESEVKDNERCDEGEETSTVGDGKQKVTKETESNKGDAGSSIIVDDNVKESEIEENKTSTVQKRANKARGRNKKVLKEDEKQSSAEKKVVKKEEKSIEGPEESGHDKSVSKSSCIQEVGEKQKGTESAGFQIEEEVKSEECSNKNASDKTDKKKDPNDNIQKSKRPLRSKKAKTTIENVESEEKVIDVSECKIVVEVELGEPKEIQSKRKQGRARSASKKSLDTEKIEDSSKTSTVQNETTRNNVVDLTDESKAEKKMASAEDNFVNNTNQEPSTKENAGTTQLSKSAASKDGSNQSLVEHESNSISKEAVITDMKGSKTEPQPGCSKTPDEPVIKPKEIVKRLRFSRSRSFDMLDEFENNSEFGEATTSHVTEAPDPEIYKTKWAFCFEETVHNESDTGKSSSKTGNKGVGNKIAFKQDLSDYDKLLCDNKNEKEASSDQHETMELNITPEKDNCKESAEDVIEVIDLTGDDIPTGQATVSCNKTLQVKYANVSHEEKDGKKLMRISFSKKKTKHAKTDGIKKNELKEDAKLAESETKLKTQSEATKDVVKGSGNAKEIQKEQEIQDKVTRPEGDENEKSNDNHEKQDTISADAVMSDAMNVQDATETETNGLSTSMQVEDTNIDAKMDNADQAGIALLGTPENMSEKENKDKSVSDRNEEDPTVIDSSPEWLSCKSIAEPRIAKVAKKEEFGKIASASKISDIELNDNTSLKSFEKDEKTNVSDRIEGESSKIIDSSPELLSSTRDSQLKTSIFSEEELGNAANESKIKSIELTVNTCTTGASEDKSEKEEIVVSGSDSNDKESPTVIESSPEWLSSTSASKDKMSNAAKLKEPSNKTDSGDLLDNCLAKEKKLQSDVADNTILVSSQNDESDPKKASDDKKQQLEADGDGPVHQKVGNDEDENDNVQTEDKEKADNEVSELAETVIEFSEKELEAKKEVKRQAMGFVCETDSDSDSDDSSAPPTPTAKDLYDEYIELSSGASDVEGIDREETSNNDKKEDRSRSDKDSTANVWLSSHRSTSRHLSSPESSDDEVVRQSKNFRDSTKKVKNKADGGERSLGNVRPENRLRKDSETNYDCADMDIDSDSESYRSRSEAGQSQFRKINISKSKRIRKRRFEDISTTSYRSSQSTQPVEVPSVTELRGDDLEKPSSQHRRTDDFNQKTGSRSTHVHQMHDDARSQDFKGYSRSRQNDSSYYQRRENQSYNPDRSRYRDSRRDSRPYESSMYRKNSGPSRDKGYYYQQPVVTYPGLTPKIQPQTVSAPPPVLFMPPPTMVPPPMSRLPVSTPTMVPPPKSSLSVSTPAMVPPPQLSIPVSTPAVNMDQLKANIFQITGLTVNNDKPIVKSEATSSNAQPIQPVQPVQSVQPEQPVPAKVLNKGETENLASLVDKLHQVTTILETVATAKESEKRDSRVETEDRHSRDPYRMDEAERRRYEDRYEDEHRRLEDRRHYRPGYEDRYEYQRQPVRHDPYHDDRRRDPYYDDRRHDPYYDDRQDDPYYDDRRHYIDTRPPHPDDPYYDEWMWHYERDRNRIPPPHPRDPHYEEWRRDYEARFEQPGPRPPHPRDPDFDDWRRFHGDPHRHGPLEGYERLNRFSDSYDRYADRDPALQRPHPRLREKPNDPFGHEQVGRGGPYHSSQQRPSTALPSGTAPQSSGQGNSKPLTLTQSLFQRSEVKPQKTMKTMVLSRSGKVMSVQQTFQQQQQQQQNQAAADKPSSLPVFLTGITGTSNKNKFPGRTRGVFPAKQNPGEFN